MPSSDRRFYGEDVGYADMVEAPRRERESSAKQIVVAALATIGVLCLSVVLILGSFPELTPEEIIQSADYEGQQPPRHIFNLYSLKQDNLRRDQKLKRQSALVAETVAIRETTDEDAPSLIEASAGAKAGNKKERVASESSGQLVVDTPVREKMPTVIRAYEKSELSRTIPLPVVSAVAGNAVPEKTDGSRAVTVLPVYSIRAERTNLRSQPSTDAPIVKMLDKGQTITVFDKSGKWFQVATNDGLGTTGYVHGSLLEIAEIE